VDRRELHGLTYRCLDDCGFCCTFTPEVTPKEEAALRQGFPRLPIMRDGERSHLAFQGGCGACFLLEARRCTAYDDRPAHCRYFPFHVHFGPEPEVLVNRTCRGVEEHAGGDLSGEFDAQVLKVAPDGLFAANVGEASAVYAEFEALAREAGVWGDAVGAARELLGAGPDLLLPSTLHEACGGPEGWAALVEEALEPFSADDPVSRPFHLDADLRWLCFRRDGAGVVVEQMAENGRLAPVARLALAKEPKPLPLATRNGLHAVLTHLVGRGVFRGQVYAIVDDLDYEVSVEDAARARVLGLAVGLLLRADLLRQMGVPDARLADEAWRFLDSAFLDAPTIGAWL
jgi:Fe-S-cluster containining protein